MLSNEQLQKYYEQYGKDKVDEAVKYLSYHHTDPLPKEESDTEPTLYVFRHGQTVDNSNFVFSGWRESPLTQKGIEQALILAEKIKSKKIDMLISSPQIRAYDTMKHAVSTHPTAKDLEIGTDERIKERSYGDFMGKDKLTMQLEEPENLKILRRSYEFVPPNGESIEMVCKRVAEFCDEIVPLMKEHKINVAVSCHGNSMRGFRKYFERLSNEKTALVETPLGQDYAAYVIR
jgi:2,3-bisphosphoglycerate-dependent phosphoglycerate mutase